MKYLLIGFAIALALLFPSSALATPTSPYPLMDGLGSLHHPVSTRNSEAQAFFDKGLKLVYAFNHEEAVRSFQRAAELDPQLAIAYWGVALALGPNINMDVDPEREQAAYHAIQTATKLAAANPQTSAQERDYIAALTKRYSLAANADLKQLAVDYKNAMSALARRYPKDLDAATLYAESAMDLHPWQLWSPTGQPAEGTQEILNVLESVLKREPLHLGANHYYIHALEASPYPEHALASAERLTTLAPAAGHLVHMPAHIYFRVGDYAEAVQANQRAIAADEAYFQQQTVEGTYPLMYYNHNIHFLAVAASMAGNYDIAKQAADKLVANALPAVAFLPMVEGYMGTPLLMQVRFQDWDGILKTPRPDSSLLTTTALWHYAQGMASAATNQPSKAKKYQQELLAAMQTLPAEATISVSPASTILSIAANQLDAQIARGQKDYAGAIAALEAAVATEDSLSYQEPPDWYIPSREMLGDLLLEQGNPKTAETVFRADLKQHPNNGRSLQGLQASLTAQSKTATVP